MACLSQSWARQAMVRFSFDQHNNNDSASVNKQHIDERIRAWWRFTEDEEEVTLRGETHKGPKNSKKARFPFLALRRRILTPPPVRSSKRLSSGHLGLGLRVAAGNLRQRIRVSMSSGFDIPALDMMPSETLVRIFTFLLEEVSMLTVETRMTMDSRRRNRRMNEGVLRRILGDAAGLLFACRRLRREFLGYLVREELFYCVLRQPSPQAIPEALRIVDVHQLNLLQIQLGVQDWVLRSGSAAFIDMVVKNLPNLRYLSLKHDEHKPITPPTFAALVAGLVVPSFGMARPMEIGGLLRVGAFLVLRHPYLRRLSHVERYHHHFIHLTEREIALSSTRQTPASTSRHCIRYGNGATPTMLNATMIRRCMWDELISDSLPMLMISDDSVTSNLPDLPENQGFFNRVDEEGPLVARELGARNSRKVELDDLVAEARTIRDLTLMVDNMLVDKDSEE